MPFFEIHPNSIKASPQGILWGDGDTPSRQGAHEADLMVALEYGHLGKVPSPDTEALSDSRVQSTPLNFQNAA